MKPYSYYQTTSVSIPKKEDYMTIYYYKKGLMIAVKKQFETDYEPPKNCVEERFLDEISYNAHLKHYREELLRLQEEFRQDVLEKYHMTKHPKANKIFDKAWEIAGSLGYRAVEDHFEDLIELFQEEQNSQLLIS